MVNQNIRKLLGKIALWSIFLVLVLFVVLTRLYEYGNLLDSVGTIDTQSYIETSELKFPSLAFFTSGRSATLPLVYKIFRPQGGYQLNHISKPGSALMEIRPKDNPGFERVINFQIAMAILGWVSLAFVLFRHLNNIVVRIVSVILVLLFGLSPQMADWDQILLSESLSFSFFALMIASIIELAFSLIEKRPAWVSYIWIGLLTLVTTVWIFTRDTNNYFILFSIFLVTLLITFAFWRKPIDPVRLIMLLIAWVMLFGFHQATFRISDRWLKPFLNNMTQNIFPYTGRVKFFEARGMPVTPELLRMVDYAEYSGIYEQDEFIAWAKRRGLSSYMEFLIRSPIWAFQSIYNDMNILFSENVQPYFRVTPSDSPFEKFLQKTAKRPWWLLIIGESLHPVSSGVLFISLFLTSMIIILAFRWRTPQAITWAILACWIFLGGLILLITGYLGEVRSIIRHAMAGVVPLRLSVWLLSAILADLILSLPKEKNPARS